jgi:spore germination protein YaaH
MESFKKNARKIDIIAPQIYGVTDKGELFGAPDMEFLEVARVSKVKIMPLVVNSSFKQSVMEKILTDTVIQDKIILALITEAKVNDYWGWQFDFEQMPSTWREQYSDFCARAGKEFKAHNLIFSIAVIAQHSDKPEDYVKNVWEKIAGVYDFRALGQSADFISIMSYDQPDSKGPVASLYWMQKVVEYALTQIPAEKISVGVPFYWWKWDDKTGKLVDIGGYKRVKELADLNPYAKFSWSEADGTAYVKYKKAGQPYTLWYENQQSFLSKISLVDKYNLHGFSAWVLGLEDPRIFNHLKANI